MTLTPVDDAYRALARRLGIRVSDFWPDAAPYALCVTHDMDRLLSTIQRAKKLARKPSRATAALYSDIASAASRTRWEQNPFFSFASLLKLQAELGFRSAIYVLFEKRRWRRALSTAQLQHAIGVYRPEWIKNELAALNVAGNEIGVHGSFDSAYDGRHLATEKAQLEAWGIDEVSGVRNHYLGYDDIRTPEAQHVAAIRYDSTMGFNFTSGFRAGTCFPYRRHGLWELPFQLMDTALRYQFPNFEERVKCTRAIQDSVRSVGGTLVVNWHTHVLNERYFAEEVELLCGIINRAREDGAWIATPRDLIHWWEQRASCESQRSAVV